MYYVIYDRPKDGVWHVYEHVCLLYVTAKIICLFARLVYKSPRTRIYKL